MKWFPASASVAAHIFCIKAVLVVFDLMILGVILWLLSQLKIHTGWAIAYAWNPLVVKEISNGGHLDSIAAFFLILSICLLSKWFSRSQNGSTSWLTLSGISLGLGVGAKLFPIVLFPALFVMIARVGWSKAMLFAAAFAVVAGLSFYPMYRSINQASQDHRRQMSLKVISSSALSEFPPAQSTDGSQTQHSVDDSAQSNIPQSGPDVTGKKEGLTSFLSKWRMNDVIFSGIYLNLKPTTVSNNDLPWYVLTTAEFRSWSEQQWQSLSSNGDEEDEADSGEPLTRPKKDPAFSMTRVLTLGPFLLFYLWQLFAIYRGRPASEAASFGDVEESPEAIEFSRLVWILVLFLFLQPTVNPWYWVWVAPLTVLTKNRGWILAGGLLLTYYSRFWFESLPKSFEVAGYSGVGLFDHGVAWIEFGAVIGVIAITGAYKIVKQ